jgi:phosphopantothenoylcysteine decarboxylase/phosphopantothenate--cysteine ligase
MKPLVGKTILLIITGGVAAYKSLELIRLVRELGGNCRCVLTAGGSQFVTPLAVSSLSENKVYQELFSLTDESEMGHIRLSREADLLVVAPATAHLMARLAAGIADDLATTTLLATDKQVLLAPAMNVRMWENAATQANLNVLETRGIRMVGPNEGDMACGEWGVGRMAEPAEIVSEITNILTEKCRLDGLKALVTSGPTREPLDPVRYLSNHSSGRQGHAIAASLARMGAETILVSGPVSIPDPPDVRAVHVETAVEMLDACKGALPVDVAICAAAVSDWRPNRLSDQKIKKGIDSETPTIELSENPDILAHLSMNDHRRPRLVVGFAAETSNIVDYAKTKLARKGCDWILANDVSATSGTFGGSKNTISFISSDGEEAWPSMTKEAVADRLAGRIADFLEAQCQTN